MVKRPNIVAIEARLGVDSLGIYLAWQDISDLLAYVRELEATALDAIPFIHGWDEEHTDSMRDGLKALIAKS